MFATRQLAQVFAKGGLPALAWRFQGLRAQRRRALILMYHRVADEADYLGLCVPPAVFDRQLELLRRRVRVLSLRDLVDRLRDPTALEEDIAAITFDDGYRDNLERALPILKRHGLPATVFVTTDFLDGTLLPTAERLQEAFNLIWQRGTSADAWPGRDRGVDHLVRTTFVRRGSLRALRRLAFRLHRAKEIPWSQSERVLAAIEEIAGGPQNHGGFMLDWDGARTLVRHGVEIASHTVSHPILSRVSLERAEHELRGSKERIEAEIGQPVVGFAYPNGHVEDFTKDHIALLSRLGYAYACTAERGGNVPGSNPFRLQRIGVGRDSQALLDLKLALAGPVQPCAA